MVDCLAMEEAMAAAEAVPVVSETPAMADPERCSRWAAAPRIDRTHPCRQS